MMIDVVCPRPGSSGGRSVVRKGLSRGEVMPDSSSTAVEAKAPVEFGLAEAIRGYFRDDRSRMTMSAARKFGVPEQKVLEALIGQWPIVRLRDGAFRELMEALPDLGLMRVFVRSRAAVIEAVGTFGGFSETGPFFNVQTDTLDMHILAGEVAAVFGVQKVGHDSTINTYSFQLFDHDGAAAFKVFLWDGYPDVPAHRIEAFHELSRRFAADPDSARDAWLDLGESGGHDSSVEAEGLPPSAEALSVGTSPEIAPQTAAGSAAARPTIVEPGRVQIPLPEGVVPGSSSFGQKILDDSMADEHQVVEPMPRSVVMVKYSIRGTLALVVLSFLCLLAILAAPFFWLHFENYPRLTDAPKTVQTEQSDASDPLNVALLGGE